MCVCFSLSFWRFRAKNRQYVEKHLKMMVCVCASLHIWEWSNSAPIVITALGFKSTCPCFMERTKPSTAACVPLCLWGVKLKPLNTEFPQCVSVAELLVLNVCVLFHWENSMFNSSPSFSFHTYGEEARWLPVEFHCEVHTVGLVQGSLKGTREKKFLFIFSILHAFLPF